MFFFLFPFASNNNIREPFFLCDIVSFYFLFVIVSLIACLLCLLTVLVVTSIVYLAGEEEMQILFEMKDIDTRMFRLELT